MIAEKFVDLYARNSGLRDKLVAERDVVLTYALRGLADDGVTVDPEAIIASVASRFGILRQLTELEEELIADAKSGWNEPMAERLRAEIRDLAT